MSKKAIVRNVKPEASDSDSSSDRHIRVVVCQPLHKQSRHMIAVSAFNTPACKMAGRTAAVQKDYRKLKNLI
jgi:hypothetical protein